MPLNTRQENFLGCSMPLSRFICLLRAFYANEEGMAVAEMFIIISLFVILPVIIFLSVFGGDLLYFLSSNKYIELASATVIFVGGLFASIAWGVKRVVSSTDKIAVIQIIELLSASDGMTRDELYVALKKQDFTYLILPTLLGFRPIKRLCKSVEI